MTTRRKGGRVVSKRWRNTAPSTGRRTRSREFMAVRRERLEAEKPTVIARRGPGPLPVAVLYPASYSEGMAALALHVLLDLFNAAPCAAERVFDFPEVADITRSLETASPLGDFALVLVTVPFELHCFTVARMLEDGGVPALAAERTEGDPVVIMGGPVVSANPAPLAALTDLAYVGEVEAQIGTIRATLTSALAQGGSREALIHELASVPGMLHCAQWLAGEIEAPVRRQWGDVNEYVPRTVILAPEAELSGRSLVEVARGCPHRCRFCLARRLYHPLRPRSPEVCASILDELAQVADTVGLVAPSFSDHPQAIGLLQLAGARGLRPSVSSLRAESLLAQPELAEVLVQGGQRTITLAPEAGTQHLRDVIGKPLTDEQLLEAADLVARVGLPHLKLYFMIGLPGETDDDMAAIGDLLAAVRRRTPSLELSASVACFVPKSHTPCEGEALADEEAVRYRSDLLRRLSGKVGVAIDVDSPRAARAQAAIARGGLELGPLLPPLAHSRRPEAALLTAIKKTRQDAEDYVRSGAPDAPWTVIDLGCPPS